MKVVLLKDVKKNDLFRFKNDVNAPIWKKSHYDRSSKTYSLYPISDYRRELFRKGTIKVYVEDYV